MQHTVEAASDLDNPLLKRYSLSERRAIVVHKYFLGIDLNREPSLVEAVASWEVRHASRWRREKALKDVAAQLREIEVHKYFLSQSAGHDVGWDRAARDWISSHAGAWREWWESQPASCP